MSAIALGQLTALILLGGVAASGIYFRGELARARAITPALRPRTLAVAFTGGVVAAVGMGGAAPGAPTPAAGLVASITAAAGAAVAGMSLYGAFARRRVLWALQPRD